MISAVLQTSFLGDMVLTTPLIERLAREGLVHVVATPANAAVLANHPAVASVIVFDKRGSDRGWGGVRRVAQAIQATGAERAYLAQGSWRTAALAWLAGVPERIGFATSAGRWLYTRQVPYTATAHHAQRLWQLAAAAHERQPGMTLRPSLFPSAQDRAAADDLLHAAGVLPDTPLVALAPGSVWATKRWPSYDALAAALVPVQGPLADARLVVVGGAEDAPLAAAIGRAVQTAGGPTVIDATGRLSLLGSAALLARCRALVSNDSAPLHLASAMNTPTVALFGPTVPSLGFGPLAERHQSLGRDALTCRPCHAHGPQRCPLGHWRCMQELEVPQVVAAVTALASGA